MLLKIATILFFLLTVFFAKDLSAQYRISGKVTDSTSQPLSYVSIDISGSTRGTTTNQDGIYTIDVNKGTYTLDFTIIGFKTKTVTITVNADHTENVMMEADNKGLSEVLVTVTRKDRAEEIIEKVIRQKENTTKKIQNASYKVYVKATEENDRLGKSIKVLSRPIKKNEALDQMNMAEVLLQVDYAYPDKIKEQRTAVKLRGNANNLFFLTTTQGDFDFYKNLIKAPQLTKIPMLSPISYSGLMAYRFKTVNIRTENGRKIYTIKVIPSQSGNALVHGEVEVLDSAWVLLSTHFEFPKYHLLDYENFTIDQQYEFINDKAWVPVRQEFNYTAKLKHYKTAGKTTAVYQDYIIDTSFSKNHFSSQLSSTSHDAYTRDLTFWDDVRKEPLSDKEFRFIVHHDSLYRLTHSKEYLDSIDRDYNKITVAKVLFFGQGIYNRNKEKTITLPPLRYVIKPLELGGIRFAVDATYTKIYPSKKKLFIRSDISYGIRNKDLKGKITYDKMYNPFNKAYYYMHVGREFDFIFDNDSWVSGFKRSNIYEKYSASLENGFEVFNGFYFKNNIEFESRNSIENYKFSSKYDTLFRGTIINNRPVAFDPYKAFYTEIKLSYVPKQLYRREPKEKVILGSKWPTFNVMWRKGIPGIFNSKINFDYLEFGITQKLKLGLVGVSDYGFITGSFLNTKKLGIVDYKYMRRGDPILFTEPSRNFQALDSTFPVFKRFYEGHYLHNFNGSILNKIPGFRKLNISEIVGAGILYLTDSDLRYAEGFAGLEKIFTIFNEKVKLGAFVVGSVANKSNKPVQFKIALQYYNRTTKRWN